MVIFGVVTEFQISRNQNLDSIIEKIDKSVEVLFKSSSPFPFCKFQTTLSDLECISDSEALELQNKKGLSKTDGFSSFASCV